MSRAAIEMRVVLLDPPDLDRDQLEQEVAWLTREAFSERLGAVNVNVTRIEQTP